jgi:hypothetical protein
MQWGGQTWVSAAVARLLASSALLERTGTNRCELLRTKCACNQRDAFDAVISRTPFVPSASRAPFTPRRQQPRRSPA